MKQPIEEKAAQPGSRGGDGSGTVSRAKHYPRRGAGARPNAEPWQPVRIGDIVDEALRRILREGAES